jgi:hypothetical protein
LEDGEEEAMRGWAVVLFVISAACGAAPEPENASLEGAPIDRPGRVPKKGVLPPPPPALADGDGNTPPRLVRRSFDVAPAAPATFGFVWSEENGAPPPDGRELVVSHEETTLVYVTSSRTGPSIVATDARSVGGPPSIAPSTTYTVYATLEKDAYASPILVLRVRAPNGNLVIDARRALAKGTITTKIDVDLPNPSFYRAPVTLQ